MLSSRLWVLISDSRVTEETLHSFLLVALGCEGNAVFHGALLSALRRAGALRCGGRQGFSLGGPGVALPSSSPPQQCVPTSLSLWLPC